MMWVNMEQARRARNATKESQLHSVNLNALDKISNPFDI
jgi:hypothetical protein